MNTKRIPANRTLGELQEDVLQVFLRAAEGGSSLEPGDPEFEYLTALCRRITWRGERGLK